MQPDQPHVVGTSGSTTPKADVSWIARGRSYVGLKWSALTADWPDMPELED